MVKCSKLIACAVLLCVGRGYAAAADVEFSFSGAVSFVSSNLNPFGGGWTPGTAVVGHVIYDPSSVATDPLAGCDCMGYRQHIPGGFAMLVGSTLLRADDYVVQVKNNFDQQGVPVDTLSVLWSSDTSISPPLPSPLLVNGVPWSSALVQLNLDSASDTFPDSSLPPTLDLGKFSSTSDILDDNRTDHKIAALFQATALTSWGGPGDYNLNGTVEPDDYDAWRSNFGLTNNLAADGNVNGVRGCR